MITQIIVPDIGDFKDFEITEKYFQLLEEQIKDEPEYYLWSHKRWKHAKN